MGLPESTNKTHREKEKKKHLIFFFLGVSAAALCVLSPLVRALRAQFEEDAVTLQGSTSPGSDQSWQ